MAIQQLKGKRGVRYKVVLSHAGKTEYIGTFATKSEADEAEIEAKYIRRQVRNGTAAPEAMATRRTVDELADAYLLSLESPRASAHSSRAEYARLLNYWRREIGTVRIVDLRARRVQRVLEQLCYKFSPATVDGYLTPLSGALSWAVRQGWLSKNPCRDLPFVNERGARASRDYKWLRTQDEIESFLNCVEPGLWRDVLATAIGTGLRLGELQAVRWSDVSIKQRLITVQRSVKGPTKSRKIRHVPILDSVHPLLRERQLKADGAELVFPGPQAKFFSRAGLRKVADNALKAAELDEDIRLHDLRHTFASHWVMNGGSVFKLSRVLGHSSVKITEKTYAHLAPDAFSEDFKRVVFAIPGAGAEVIKLPNRT